MQKTVERLVREREPDVIGPSLMTFQRRTARQVARLVRALRPGARSWWGYDPSRVAAGWTPGRAVL